MTKQPNLTTERLILRPFELSDAPTVQQLVGDPAIANTTLNIPHPYLNGMAEGWIATHQPQFEIGTSVVFAITLRTTGELIGAIGLEIEHRHDRAELGYWIGVPYWGQGYCTEAGNALFAYGFTDLALNRIYACHFTRNPASGKVMQKLGMIQEGFARKSVKKGDQYEDIVNYSVLREDWVK
jgi:[ribosomal protein S5]-alanine N-acetyltransferase